MRRIIVACALLAFLTGITIYAQEAQKAKEAVKAQEIKKAEPSKAQEVKKAEPAKPKSAMPESKNAPKFDPTRDPEKDLAEAIAKAKESGKFILLDIGGEWCIWCKRLDIYLYDNAELNKMYNDAFEVVKVNYSQENKNEAFLSKYPKVAGYPHFFILDKNGKLMQSQDTGVLESGGTYSLRKLISFLTIWGTK